MTHETPGPSKPTVAPETEQTSELPPHPSPRIYVASLADYNAGRLHGRWIDANQDPDDLRTEIAAMLGESHEPVAADWAIHDYENFSCLQVEEHVDIEIISQVARGIAEYGAVFAAWADLHYCDPAALDVFADAYLGHYPSAADYARDLVEQSGYNTDLDRLIPKPWRTYVTFDAEQLVHDMQLEGSIVVYPDDHGNGVWIFDVY